MAELYENFMPTHYMKDTPDERFEVRYFGNGRQRRKNFTKKTYKTNEKAIEAAWIFFEKKYPFLNIEVCKSFHRHL